MKTLNDLIYWSGGYSGHELKHARALELRQIRHLGVAVLLSVLASAISWAIVYDGLFKSDIVTGTAFSPVFIVLTECLLLVLVVTIAFALNRSIIFLSEMQQASVSSWMVPTFRILLILVATITNASLLPGKLEIFAFVLAVLEVYPVALKWQMGQTLSGRRWSERQRYEIERCDLKVEEHNTALELEKHAARSKYQDQQESFD